MELTLTGILISGIFLSWLIGSTFMTCLIFLHSLEIQLMRVEGDMC